MSCGDVEEVVVLWERGDFTNLALLPLSSSIAIGSDMEEVLGRPLSVEPSPILLKGGKDVDDDDADEDDDDGE